MNNKKIKCICGDDYGLMCKLSTISPNTYTLDTSLLTHDPVKNMEIARTQMTRNTTQHRPIIDLTS